MSRSKYNKIAQITTIEPELIKENSIKHNIPEEISHVWFSEPTLIDFNYVSELKNDKCNIYFQHNLISFTLKDKEYWIPIHSINSMIK